MDCSGKGALAQRMKRSFKHHSFAATIFKDMLDVDKQRFRESFAVAKSFDFLKESRVKIHSESHAGQEIGEFLPIITIAGRLGSATSEECKAMAKTYAKNCKAHGNGKDKVKNKTAETGMGTDEASADRQCLHRDGHGRDGT